jgi:hypothetical protein
MTRKKELGNIEKLNPGFTFDKCGGTMIKYPGKDYDCKPHIEIINEHETECAQWAIICNATKTLKNDIQRSEDMTFWEVGEND